jgi:hypothetical protein
MKSMPRKKVLTDLLQIHNHSHSIDQPSRKPWNIWILAGISLVLALVRINLGLFSTLSPTAISLQTSTLPPKSPIDSIHVFLGTALLTFLAIVSTRIIYRTLMDSPDEFERINQKHFLQILLGSILLFLIILSTLSILLTRGLTGPILSEHHFLVTQNIELISVLLIGNIITLLLGKKSAMLFFLISAMIIAVTPTSEYEMVILPLIAGPISSNLALALPGRIGSLKSGLLSGMITGGLFWGMELSVGNPSTFTVKTELFSIIATTLLFPMLENVAMPLLEKSLSLLSEASLTELLDLNHPLLQEFSQKAPGSFFHSLSVAQIAEAAALSIGENTKLARVSAYFHDIGKMDKPQYFIENQTTFNRHELLTPRMSSLILIDHVRKGIEIAKKHGLPEAIISAIPEHHGTRVMQYFLRKSRDSSSSTTDLPSESDFRYPGPKPQTKITAILMMADAIEATGRAVKIQDSSPARAISVIDETLLEIQRDGQLDECPLTLSEIAILKEVFARTLLQTQHKRIVYPGIKLPGNAPSWKPTNAS